MKVDCENNPLAGLRREEARPLTSVGGCPPYAGVGNNRLVGRQGAGLREHNLGSMKTDSDAIWNQDCVEWKVKDCNPMSHSNTNDLCVNAAECSNDNLGTLRLRGGGSPPRNSGERFTRGSALKKSKEATTGSTAPPSDAEVSETSTNTRTRSRPRSRKNREIKDIKDNKGEGTGIGQKNMDDSGGKSRSSEENDKKNSGDGSEKEREKRYMEERGKDSRSPSPRVSSGTRHQVVAKRVHPDKGEPKPYKEPQKINTARRRRKDGGVGSGAPRLKLKIPARCKKAAKTYAGLSATCDKLRNSVGWDPEEEDEEPMDGEGDQASSSGDKDPIEAARRAAQTVLEQTAKSADISGSVRGAINDACSAIKAAMEQLQAQHESEEIRSLRADNKRMREELALMRSETKALRKAFSERGMAAPQVALAIDPNGSVDRLRVEMETLLDSFREKLERENTRLQEGQRRLPPEEILRPSLAADRRRAEVPQPAAREQPSPQLRARRQSGGSGRQAAATGATLMPPARPAPTPQTKKTAAGPKPVPAATTQTPPTQGEWTQVVKRGRKKKKKATPPAASATQTAKPPSTPAPKRLAVPKTAAVVVALKPEAKESYASVMLRATQAFRLEEIGLEHINVRKTADGARILEVAGADNGRTADALKVRLEAAIGDVARVYRPVKMARLRVSGLDETATPEAVAKAIAAKGGCSHANIRVGDIRIGYSGAGSALVQCPIEAASAAASAGRATIGWSSARIETLEPEVLRCFKCLGIGHTRGTCPSSVERSDLCFRCSKPGHRGAACQAEAFCAVCHQAKLPAGHRMGGFSCNPPKDLLMQNLAEWGVALAAVAEPYTVPPRPNWARDGRVALVAPALGDVLVSMERGDGFVAAKWGGIIVVGVYFSPNLPLNAFQRFLEDLEGVVRRAGQAPILVLGDFNAKSRAWGSPNTEPRGAEVEVWSAAAGLVLLNCGNAQTCVRWNGGSIVDLSFATPDLAARITEWRVLEDEETLSDHLYIRMRVSPLQRAAAPRPNGRQAGKGGFPRWSLARLDREMAEEAAIIEAWNAPQVAPRGIDERAVCFRRSLEAVCDASMPRARPARGKKQVYWWTPEIAALRTASNNARRAYTRCRRRRHTAEEEELLRTALAEKTRALQQAIRKAKNEGWEEFLATLNRDPWGRPYRMVRNKLQSAPPMDSMEPELLRRVVEGLFPEAPDFVPPVMASPAADPAEPLVVVPITDDEIEWAMDRVRATRKAAGPDGVPGKVLFLALKHLGNRLKSLLDDCLEEGRFPRCWKEGRLCLLRKEGRPPDSPAGYRPIVLLDEIGKLFERILVSRIQRHLVETGPNLHDSQFGFRRGRSTIDAVAALRDFGVLAAGQKEGVVAVSLDIANAFGSLPYTVIGEALRYHGVPHYLRRVIEHYLTARVVLYEQKGVRSVRAMMCGVPQGSVLGPLLWNIGYDWAIRGVQFPRMVTVCYADDTLVAVRGKELEEVLRRAAVATELTIQRIELLGLRVALPKTEAMVLGRTRGWGRLPAGTAVRVGGESVQVKAHIKYLGLVLDRKWTFEEHFARLAPRLVGAASALGRLLRNLGGPNAPCRRLYAGVVRSMALYGAPIWAGRLTRCTKALLRRPQRVVAQRMVRAYRTTSHAATCLLAGTPPWELDAGVLAERYWWRAEARGRGEPPNTEDAERVSRAAAERLRERWRDALEDSHYGTRTIGAILPVMDEWVDRSKGALTYRVTQVVSGHGCFGHYLHKIQREPGPQCHECGAADDTAQHTLEECNRWAVERAALRATTGVADLSLRSIIAATLGSERKWEAVTSFCEEIMSQKEAAERVREAAADALPLRRRRQGRVRRAYARLEPQ
ncbi:uncharacterized protein LOC134796497 [Cydia splendana]|uniref:uncharacterized protein LOC134796497 n=1 Tax=Cydia splendana TaxID=1100963 RepID=UPI00300D32E0